MTTFIKTSVAVAAVALTTLSGTAGPASGQSIAERVARVPNGSVRMSFAARPGVCGSGNSIHHGNRGRTTWNDNRWESSRDVEWDSECAHGPVRVVLDRSDGHTSALRFYVGGRWRPGGADATDLGLVSARDAANYLVSVAQTDRGAIGSKAIFPATIADSADVWPALMRVARNPDVPRGTRTQAVFWIGQAAGEAATADLGALVVDNTVDREVREQAVFALSQRPRDQSIPALIKVARTNRDPEIRKKAIFWLGQSDDPRALDLFEELLTRP
ncbi:MAG: HEAT repeat domain-containing protein [Gemmatimonadota bacterium]|nr:HEAT repeat domain-containing protein [Gemmatimonadota bacterium]